MRGSYNLVVKNNRVCYNLVFNRCITIIKGDSGIGKTELITMLLNYLNNGGKKSGVHLSTNANSIRVLLGMTEWQNDLESHPNSLYFADENVKYILTKEFRDELFKTGSYLVYITRSGKTGYLQYSVSSIYYFSSRKDGNRYLTEMYNVYENNTKNFKPDLILTEDSTSGLDMLTHALSTTVKSSYGKDNVVNKLREYSSLYSN